MPSVLIVDDEPTPRTFIRQLLADQGYATLEADTVASAHAQIDLGQADIVLLDVMLPDGSGLRLLERLAQEQPGLPVIVITGFGDIEMAVEAMQTGAQDFLTKPMEARRLLKALSRASETVSLRRELEHLRQSRRDQYSWVVGETPAMKRVDELLQRAAPTQASILISGETGSGKEVVANAIHQLSPRNRGPFIPINCAALPDHLLESELFGHEPGAFTGATKRKLGLLEVADSGTVFLDEISSMKPDLQSKLLRAIEEKVIYRVGGTSGIKVDVRFISASNRNLPAMIADGKFREDLYWRLKVICVELPPLRDRREDIPALAGRFLDKFNLEMGKEVIGIHPRAMEALKAYHWPGNIRQLRSVIENAMLFCDGDTIEIGYLPAEIVAEPTFA
ncbi:MAG: sigma-54-dependent Fis family transcriptional regulator [Chloroflexi bacterium]|nr:sigma-54-dependent Fis family transcriptional regulator [Chloroflexota bacterium]